MKISVSVFPARRAALAVAGAMLVGVVAAGCVAQAGANNPSAPGAGVAAAAKAPLVLHADTVLGNKGLEKGVSFCDQQNLFARGESIVWRARVTDPRTGQPMSDKNLASVDIKLPDQSIAMHYGGHPAQNPVDSFWSASFAIPTTYPTGQLPYTITATAKDGRTGTFEQFKVTLAMLQVTDDPLPTPEP